MMSQLPRFRIAAVLLAGLIALPWGCPASAEERPRRVVSLNLCADQLLLHLADRDQIAALGPDARDEALSFLAREAREVPGTVGRGEVVLLSGADLVLVGRFGSHTKRELLEAHGLRLIVLDPWRSLEHGRAQIREVAAGLGHPERGERLIRAIDAAMARATDIVPKGRRLLVLHRRGWVPGLDGFNAELLRHMGFTLHQEALGLQRGGLVRLETLVAGPPDYVLVDKVAGGSIDNGSAFLGHPALNAALPPERRLSIPDNLTICAGPSTPAAVDALAAEVRAKVR